jgi:hypothetical protein
MTFWIKNYVLREEDSVKIVCDCGNEMEFVPDNEEFEEDENGTYVNKDYKKFDFWAEHDETGITCKQCKKSIWYFA